jgi:hypothetical protein
MEWIIFCFVFTFLGRGVGIRESFVGLHFEVDEFGTLIQAEHLRGTGFRVHEPGIFVVTVPSEVNQYITFPLQDRKSRLLCYFK